MIKIEDIKPLIEDTHVVLHYDVKTPLGDVTKTITVEKINLYKYGRLEVTGIGRAISDKGMWQISLTVEESKEIPTTNFEPLPDDYRLI